jgi:DNA replication licensing factor MCM7
MRLVDSIEMNTKHYVEIFSRAVDEVLPPASADITWVFITGSPIYPINIK